MVTPQGDKLLEKLGEIIKRNKETKKDGHRYGGDEFTFLFKNPEEANSKMEILQEDFSNLEGVLQYGLKPNLDVGLASFGEAVKIVRNLLKTNEGKERIEKGKVFKEFNTVWLMLADKRAFLEKAQKRIPFLMEKYQEGYDLKGKIINEEAVAYYDFLVKYLGKGACEITKEKISELIKNSNNDIYKRDELVWEYIKEVEKEKINKETEYSILRDLEIAYATKIIEKNDVTKLAREEKLNVLG